MRKQDVQADRGGASAVRSAVDRFHEAGAAAGDDREAGIGQQSRNEFRLLVVIVMRLHARAAEHAHRWADTAQPLSGDGEFCHNAEYPPRFLPVGRVHRLRVDQLGNLVRLNHA